VSDPTAELSIDGWRQGLRFAASHVVPNHPKCGHLHGHTYAVDVELDGEVPPGGMIMDFGDVKEALRVVVDELDHRWVLPRDPEHGTVQVEDRRVVYEVDGKRWDVPASDVAFLDVPVATAEFLAHHVADAVLERVAFPGEVDRLRVGVDEGYGKGAWTSRSP